MTGGMLHQGIALQVPPFEYRDLRRPAGRGRRGDDAPPLLVALDGVTDPRNLGAVIRSAVAFGAHGVIVPERRAAGVTAAAWRTSAGTAARMPVAQVTNLVRALKDCQQAGHVRASGSTPTATHRSTTSSWRPTRSSSWSAPRAAGCPGWSARPAT